MRWVRFEIPRTLLELDLGQEGRRERRGRIGIGGRLGVRRRGCGLVVFIVGLLGGVWRWSVPSLSLNHCCTLVQPVGRGMWNLMLSGHIVFCFVLFWYE